MPEEKGKIEGFDKRGEPKPVPSTEKPPLAPGGEARPGKDLNVRERAGALGGDRFDPRTASYGEIEERVNIKMEILERAFVPAKYDDPRVEEVLKLLGEALEAPGRNSSDQTRLHHLRELVQAKLACLEFYHGPWRQKEATGGATAVLDYGKEVDDGHIFTYLLQDRTIAEEFGKLVNDTSSGPERENRSWNTARADLEKAAKRGDSWTEKLAAKMYAWMLWDIAFMHAEADDPEFNNYVDSYTAKATVNVQKYLEWEGIDPENRAFLNSPVIVYRARGVNPVDATAARAGIRRQLIPNALSVRTGRAAIHGELFDVGNYFCWGDGIQWANQPETIKSVIHDNQQNKLNRVVQDKPRGVEEVRGINWSQVDLTPGKGLRGEGYRLYLWMRRQSEFTLNWIRDELIPARAKWLQGENLALVSKAVLGAQIYKDWLDRERSFTEGASIQSELLWTHAMSFEASGMLRDREMTQRMSQYCAPGGDGERWLNLYGRTFSERSLRDTPISPYQAAFMLLRIYGSHRQPIEADGRHDPVKLLNQAANKKEVGGYKWQQCARESGHPRQTFTQYLTELEGVARALDNHNQGIARLSGEELAQYRQKAAALGLREEGLSWNLAALTRDEILRQGDWRLAFLLANFSVPVYRFAMFQYVFFENLIKDGIGYHQADENQIYWKQRIFEQIWAGLLVNLRNFTEDGQGDRFSEFLAGKRLVSPIPPLGKEYKHKYKPPEEDSTENAPLYLEAIMTRKIEYLMMLLSEDYSLRHREYWVDPEDPRKKIYPWQAVGSVEDRHTAMLIITELSEGADYFSETTRKELRRRFHCTLAEVAIHQAIRRFLGLKGPPGAKEVLGETEKKGKGFLGFLPVIGQYLGWLPMPRSITEWALAPMMYVAARTLIALLNPLIRSTIILGSIGLEIPLSPLFGLSLSAGKWVLFELSIPYMTGVLLLRWPLLWVLQSFFRTLGTIPGLKLISARESKVNLKQRLTDMGVRM